MPRRRSRRGTGTVYREHDPRRSTRYRAAKYITVGGKRKRVIGRGNTVAEAEEALAANIRRAKDRPKSERTVNEFLDEWLEHKRSRWHARTYEDHAYMLRRYVRPVVGTLYVAALEARDIPLERIRTDSGATTANKVRRYMRQALDYAVRVGYLSANPLANVEAYHVPRSNREIWEREQIRAFLDAAKGSRYYGLFYVAIFTGLRKGELVALRWANVTPTHILVRESMGGAPKRGSVRDVPYGADVAAVLEAQRELAGQHAYVFATDSGKMVAPSNLTRELRRYARKAKVPLIPFHNLRRIAATLWLRRGVPVNVVQRLLGHSTARMTLEVYAQVQDEQMSEVALGEGDLG